MMLAFIDNAYTREKLQDTNGKKKRIVLKLDKRLSPVKVAVFPLLKRKNY